jgi:hypothetical protein
MPGVLAILRQSADLRRFIPRDDRVDSELTASFFRSSS